MTPPVEMTKGRPELPATVVAEQDPLFIALGGPKAHDSSGRDDNSVAVGKFTWQSCCPHNCCSRNRIVIPTGAQWRDLGFL
jgi:hypothetical protein